MFLQINSYTIIGSNLPKQLGNLENDFDGFGVDSTGVRFGQFFWLIGGATACFGKAYTNGQIANKNSYLWSIQKKKWFLGPKYPDLSDLDLTFTYVCPIVLNSTTILFIGLLIFNGPPKYTIIYDFERKSWNQQDSLDFHVDVDDVFEYDKNTACVMEESKNISRSRYVKNLEEP